MNSSEICKQVGERTWKQWMNELPSGVLKKLLMESKLSTTRSLAHLSTQHRNEDWIQRLWNNIHNPHVAMATLYTWLGTCRRPMLTAFLDALGVPHKEGLTEEDFWNSQNDSALQQAAQQLIQEHIQNPVEVATYLLFLEASNQTSRLAPLRLEQYLLVSKVNA